MLRLSSNLRLWTRGLCPACGRRRSAPLCGRCSEESSISGEPVVVSLDRRPLAIVGAWYGGGAARSLTPLGSALRAFKDGRDRYAGRCLARLFAESCAGFAAGSTHRATRIVPVPSDRRRLEQRGFAPASWLALALSKRSAVALLPHALVRADDRPAQRGLSGTARRLNARGAFSSGEHSPRGYAIVVVDDVVTTGATLAEAAKQLESGGAASVRFAVLACADDEVAPRCRSKTASAGI